METAEMAHQGQKVFRMKNSAYLRRRVKRMAG